MNKWKELEAFLLHEKQQMAEEAIANTRQPMDDYLFYIDSGKSSQTNKIIAFMDDLNRKEKKELKEKRQAILNKRGVRHATK